MPRVNGASLQASKERVYLTLRRHPMGLKEAELAEIMELDRRSLNNYLRALETEGKTYKEGVLWLALPYDQAQLRKFELSPEEAMTLYLAARLFVKQNDKQNEPAQTALMKLAAALVGDAKVGNEIHQAALELSRRPDDGAYNRIFRTIVQAYLYRRVAHITYEPARGRPFDTDFEPYLLEPSAIGFTTYAIGKSSIVNQLRTYKMERMRAAALTRQEYSIPREFPGLEILRNAWSIIHGEELVSVAVRFSPDVRKRVLETRWHFSEEKTDDPDKPGYLIWKAQVADTTDMLPWIKGWGADCECLEPKEMRETLIGEARGLAKVYAVLPTAPEEPLSRVLRLWGKTDKYDTSPDHFHPALFHMVDAGNVAAEFLGEQGSRRWRDALGKAFNAEPGAMATWVPYWVALHDIGKISAAFQALNRRQAARLEREGFTLSSLHLRHPIVGQAFATQMAPIGNCPTPLLAQAIQEAIGGHHGLFIDPEQIRRALIDLRGEPAEWSKLRAVADAALRKLYLNADFSQLPQPANLSTTILALTGFAILCDWLASDERYFQPAPGVELAAYVPVSRARAAGAVRGSGLRAPVASAAPVAVADLFHDLGEPRPLQRAIDNISDDLLRVPSITIIEAPTGEGKTEAALALAHRIAAFTGTEEMYYALPTTATSNQMFGRLQTHLYQRLRLAATVKLVHGQDFLVEQGLRQEMPSALIEPLGDGDGNSAAEAMAWFNSSKRALLAPFGVGTIDQAELAALNVKHASLRMMGLVGKVFIVDEVHAYDTYMTTIIERLLRWLAAMNTSVILLSATLPKSRRRQLVQAYGARSVLDDAQLDAYPSLLTMTAEGSFQARPDAWQPNRTIELCELHLTDDDAQAKAEWLVQATESGGCACWMANTVKRAQSIFAKLLEIAPAGVELRMLHSQFPLDDRQRREVELTRCFGRDGMRPLRSIVVGTQVLEQSLDLDFDVMVSDLAPIDLLLQRAGRLHRHTRVRPTAHSIPRLWINFETQEADLKIGSDRSIYAEYIQRLTHRVLAGRTRIELPRDYRTLVEAVYADEEPPADDALHPAWEDLQAKQTAASGEARQRLLPAPQARDSFAKNAAIKFQFEEDENGADWIVAQTRLGERSLNIIPLEREGDLVYCDRAQPGIRIDAVASLDIQRQLLHRHLRISQKDAMMGIQSDAKAHPTPLFLESKLLKGYYPLWLTNASAEFAVEPRIVRLRLDPQLGLVIEREGKTNAKDQSRRSIVQPVD